MKWIESCPFCGKDPVERYHPSQRLTDFGYHYHTCDTTDCPGSSLYIRENNRERWNNRPAEDEFKNSFNKLRKGNTVLLEALMDMCNQYLSRAEDENVCTHSYMSAGENALRILTEAGMASTSDDIDYVLLYSELEKRKKELGIN